MSVQFTHPYWLWLLPLAWAWLLWLTCTSGVQTGPVRRWSACATRLLITLAMFLAMAGPQWLTPVAGMNVLFVLDRSDSVPATQQEAARRWLQQVTRDKPPQDRAGLVVARNHY